jgi:hypothetical protein
VLKLNSVTSARAACAPKKHIRVIPAGNDVIQTPGWDRSNVPHDYAQDRLLSTGYRHSMPVWRALFVCGCKMSLESYQLTTKLTSAGLISFTATRLHYLQQEVFSQCSAHFAHSSAHLAQVSAQWRQCSHCVACLAHSSVHALQAAAHSLQTSALNAEPRAINETHSVQRSMQSRQ